MTTNTDTTAARGAAQSEPLRLAAIVNSDGYITNIERRQIAAELRRLHALTAAAPAAQEAEPAVQSGSVNGVLYLRYDLPEASKEQAIRDQLIALGWTPPAVPEGWRLVPVDPPPEMLRIFADEERFYATSDHTVVDKPNMRVVAKCATRSAAESHAARLNDEYLRDRHLERWHQLLEASPEAPIAAPDTAAAVLSLVLADIDTCVGEAGRDYEFKELSTETLEAIAAYRAATPAPAAPTAAAEAQALAGEEAVLDKMVTKAWDRFEAEMERLQAPAAAVAWPMNGEEDEADLGDWQDGTTKPALDGMYLRDFDEGEATSEFNGGEWTRDGFFASDVQDAPWRGRSAPAPAAGAAPTDAPADPMDWPLPCAVKVGHVTMHKGVSLRTLVARMKVLYDMSRRAPAPPQYPPMPEHWAVVASVNGKHVLCITDDALAGSGEPSDAEVQAIIGMAQHLLAFVGYGMPPCEFDPDEP